LIIAIKILIFPWVKKNAQDPDGGNMIAHLFFYLIASPEIDTFFRD
jgi:hypothetical protein